MQAVPSSAAVLLAALRLQAEWGVDEAVAATPWDRLAPRHMPAAVPPASPPAGAPQAVSAAQHAASTAATLDELRAAIVAFRDCGLAATATQAVVIDGDPASGLLFIGEAPGAEEDRSGLPFVGPSGRFLDRMLASIGLDRTGFAITNIVWWRPPGNRTPTDAEVAVCLPFLHRLIALMRPRRLVLLGAPSMRSMTGRREGITRLRGRWLEVTVPGVAATIPALATLHPAYLLRTPGAKRDAWADLRLLRRALDADGAMP
jgi:DNA polymerase